MVVAAVLMLSLVFLINCAFDFADSGKDINFVTVKGCAVVDIPRQTFE